MAQSQASSMDTLKSETAFTSLSLHTSNPTSARQGIGALSNYGDVAKHLFGR